MPAPEDTRASAQADLDIGALYARLQREVAQTTGTEGASWAELRDLAERYRAVGARASLSRTPGLRGAVLHSAKRAAQSRRAAERGARADRPVALGEIAQLGPARAFRSRRLRNLALQAGVQRSDVEVGLRGGPRVLRGGHSARF